MHYVLFGSTHRLSPRCQQLPLPPAVTAQNVSRHFLMSLDGIVSPSWEALPWTDSVLGCQWWELWSRQDLLTFPVSWELFNLGQVSSLWSVFSLVRWPALWTQCNSLWSAPHPGPGLKDTGTSTLPCHPGKLRERHSKGSWWEIYSNRAPSGF